MSDIPPTREYLGGNSRGSPEKVSATKEEEMSIIDYTETSQWPSISSATESTDLSDIFRVLSDIHFHEASLQLIAETKDDILTAKNNLEAAEHGEPSTSTRKRKVDESELHKISSKENEQLLAESKREDTKAKKIRSTESHNVSERKRRSRIKEKIKSLQQLIPNSDKRDCASILDEAIQYLKTLKDQAAQIQMMSMSMETVYYNPYMTATGIPQMQGAQYSPYGPYRHGMKFVPMPSPSLGSSGILPLVQGPTELCPPLPISGTSNLPAPQTTTETPTSNLDNQRKEGHPFQEVENDACLTGTQEASISGQILFKPTPGSIVHATHIIPPATEEPNTNM